jgi:predicted adenylyl cyclase CyaB
VRISHLRRNVELKARDPDPARSRAVCEELGADDRGLLNQRDTYFHAANGRLKLREDGGPSAELIAYTRADLPGERESAYRIVEIAEPDELRRALAETLGIEVVVTKQRHLFLWENVRIHLDAVEGLGSFIELEAVADPDSDLSPEQQRVQALRDALGIAESNLVAQSYSNLTRSSS